MKAFFAILGNAEGVFFQRRKLLLELLSSANPNCSATALIDSTGYRLTLVLLI
jgi:hypothetical protein